MMVMSMLVVHHPMFYQSVHFQTFLL